MYSHQTRHKWQIVCDVNNGLSMLTNNYLCMVFVGQGSHITYLWGWKRGWVWLLMIKHEPLAHIVKVNIGRGPVMPWGRVNVFFPPSSPLSLATILERVWFYHLGSIKWFKSNWLRWLMVMRRKMSEWLLSTFLGIWCGSCGSRMLGSMLSVHSYQRAFNCYRFQEISLWISIEKILDMKIDGKLND